MDGGMDGRMAKRAKKAVDKLASVLFDMRGNKKQIDTSE